MGEEVGKPRCEPQARHTAEHPAAAHKLGQACSRGWPIAGPRGASGFLRRAEHAQENLSPEPSDMLRPVCPSKPSGTPGPRTQPTTMQANKLGEFNSTGRKFRTERVLPAPTGASKAFQQWSSWVELSAFTDLLHESASPDPPPTHRVIGRTQRRNTWDAFNKDYVNRIK